MADNVFSSSFGLELELGLNENQVRSQISRIIEEGKLLGKNWQEIRTEIEKFGDSFSRVIDQKVNQKLQQFQQEITSLRSKFRSATSIDDKREYKEQLMEVMKARNAFINGGESKYRAGLNTAKDELLSKAKVAAIPSRLNTITEGFKRAAVVAGSFYAALAPVRKIYNFVNGIAKMNMQLRMLHYSSAMAVSSIKEAAGAMAMYGSSEQSVAQSAEAYNTQIARGRRGLGWGNIQEVAWQYGFTYRPGESYKQRIERAIRHARTLSKEERMAFAKMVDPANAKSIVAWSNRSDAEYRNSQAYSNWAANLKNVDGGNRSKTATENAEKLEEAMSRLAQSWRAIKDQIANTLLPVIIPIVNAVRHILDVLNKCPFLISAITAGVTAVAAAWSGIKIWESVRALQEFFKWLKSSYALIKGMQTAGAATSAASGIAGGAAGGIGGTAGGVTGKVPKIAGKAGGFLSFLGLGIDLGTMVATSVTAGKTWQSANTLGYILQTLRAWFILWSTVTVSHSGAKFKQAELRKQYESAFSHLKTEDPSVKKAWVDQFIAANKAMAKKEKEYVKNIGAAVRNTLSKANGVNNIGTGVIESSAQAAMQKIVTHNAPITNNNEIHVDVKVEGGGDPQATANLCAQMVVDEFKKAALAITD